MAQPSQNSMPNLKTLFPPALKNLYWSSEAQWRATTGRWRMLPSFIIIGGQRCGTTTLYNYLIRHPQVRIASLVKEIHYFDLHYAKGQNWYQAHFPLKLYKHYAQWIRQTPIQTIEASPYYIFHPHTPRRLAAIAPQTKLILLLRHPVDRAYSHYYHETRWGYEHLPTFEAAIDQEEQRMANEWAKIESDENYYSFAHHHYTYLARGIYLPQIQHWLKFFKREQLLILSSEEFYQQTAATFQKILAFLELSPWQPSQFKNFNQADNPNIDPQLRQRLLAHFQPHNRLLFDFLGTEFNWTG